MKSHATRPDPTEYAPFYETYLRTVPDGDILATLAGQIDETLGLLASVPEPEAEKPHPPYTWTIKQVVGHLIDAERIFVVRALRFARNDPTELPGFEENDYAREASSDARPLADLAEEFELLRRSNLLFFRGLPAEAWARRGVANGNPITVRALAFILAGHERHHMGIVRKRLDSGRSTMC